MQNLIIITVFLPIPHSASQPIPWDIIPMNSSLLEDYNNITNVSCYLDKENKCRQNSSDVLQDATPWRPGDNRIFMRGSGEEHPNGSQSL